MSLNQISEKLWVAHCVKSVRIRNYSGPYFPAFGLNTERYGVSLCIQSAFEKTQPRITPNTDTFHAVVIILCKQAIIKLLLAYTFRKMFINCLNLMNGCLAYSFHELLMFFWLTLGRYLIIIFFWRLIFHCIEEMLYGDTRSNRWNKNKDKYIFICLRCWCWRIMLFFCFVFFWFFLMKDLKFLSKVLTFS